METTQSSLTGILTFLALKVLCPRIAQSSTNQSGGHLFPRVPENLRETGQRRGDGAGLSLSPGKEGWRSSVLGGQGLTWPECWGVISYRSSLPPGEVFFATRLEQFTFQEALEFCESHNATLATTGQLYAAWSRGLDKCYAGWLADGSLRYPIVTPRPACGGDKPGVRTVYLYPNQTGLPDPLSRHHAFCFRGMQPRLGSSSPFCLETWVHPVLPPPSFPSISARKSQSLWGRTSSETSTAQALTPRRGHPSKVPQRQEEINKGLSWYLSVLEMRQT